MEKLFDKLDYTIIIWKDKKEACKYYKHSYFQMVIDFTDEANIKYRVETLPRYYYANLRDIDVLRSAYLQVEKDAQFVKRFIANKIRKESEVK